MPTGNRQTRAQAFLTRPRCAYPGPPSLPTLLTINSPPKKTFVCVKVLKKYRFIYFPQLLVHKFFSCGVVPRKWAGRPWREWGFWLFGLQLSWASPWWPPRMDPIEVLPEGLASLPDVQRRQSVFQDLVTVFRRNTPHFHFKRTRRTNSDFSDTPDRPFYMLVFLLFHPKIPQDSFLFLEIFVGTL